MTASLVVWSLAAPFAALTLGASPQTDAVDPAPPTALEQALVERACNTPALLMSGDMAARQRCTDAQLSMLRADYGVNLKRMSPSERGALDAACRRFEVTHGKERYLDCLNARIAAARAQRGPAPTRAAAADAPAATPAHAVAVSSSIPALPVDAPRQPSRSAAIAGALIGSVAIAAAGAMVALKRRPVRRACRDCGAAMSEAGDLCGSCRHAAAESLRRAAAERMEQVRAEEAERRRRLLAEEEERRQHAARDEEARLQAMEEVQLHEENARRQREEEARPHAAPPQAPSAAPDDEFDPYAVLGVGRDAAPDDLRAAYELARSKYDSDKVAHLGTDVQDHFREKALAVDRAYRMLAR